MNNADWLAYLDTLPPDHRDLAQKIMARIQTIINSDRMKFIDEVQRAERRSDANANRITDLTIRLDTYEATQADHVKAELETFAQKMMDDAERDQVIKVLYNLATRVEAIEDADKTGNGDAGS